MANNNKYISDLHFNHKNIIEYENRPYKDVNDMNKKIINDWNSNTNKQDYVYVIGDIGFGHKHVLSEQIMSLNGEKHLINGNHDKRSNVKYSQYKDYLKGFDNFKIVYDKGLNLLLVHDVETLGNFVNLKLLKGIDFILCGHVHGEWFLKRIEWNVKNEQGETLAINVSIEWLNHPRTLN